MLRKITTTGIIATALASLAMQSPAHGASASAAAAAPAASVAAAADPVPLVVGLRPGVTSDAPADALEDTTDIDVTASEPVEGTDAVTVDVPAGDVGEAVAALRQDPAVAYVEPDRTARVDVTANDPYRGQQWGTDLADVPAAWQFTTGSTDVVVAVVDTGVNAVADLSGALLAGRDFVNDDNNAADDHGHGTMTAGVVAARGNNRIATAGACWTCKILPVKVLDSTGHGSYSDIAAGITWAADRGADIINLSLGGDSDSNVLRTAVAHATEAGALVIAAAGNNGNTALHYPAAIPAVLAVGGSTSSDTRYSWSTYGASWVDIAAPGCNPTPNRSGGVSTFCGTSSATPFVSGVAALALAADPTATAANVRSALTGTAKPLTGGWVANGRVDADNTLRALPHAVLPADGTPPRAAFRTATPRRVRGTVAVPVSAADNGGIQRVELRVGGRLVGIDRAAPWVTYWRSNGVTGPVALSVRVVDWSGNATTIARRVVADNTAPSLRARVSGRKGGKRLKVTAAAVDRYGVSRVDLLVNGKVVARDRSGPYKFKIKTNGYGRKPKIRLRAYDLAGNVRSTPTRAWRR